MMNERIFGDEDNYETIVRVRLVVIEDIIAKLRKEKVMLRKELEGELKIP